MSIMTTAVLVGSIAIGPGSASMVTLDMRVTSWLYGQMPADEIVRQLPDRAGGHGAPAIEDEKAARKLASKGQLLFDEEHGDALFIEAADHLADLLDDVGLDPLGGLVEDHQLGV